MRLLRIGLLVLVVSIFATASALGRTSAGRITTVAGNGTPKFAGDGGPATAAEINDPYGVAVSASGAVYVADGGNDRIRKISGGTITTVAGQGTGGYDGDGGPATKALLNYPEDVALDSAGNLYIADTGNNVIRKVDSKGVITTVAGTGTAGYSGDNGPATSAELNLPYGLAVDSSGNLYIADWGNNRIREVSKGIIRTVAGTGTAGYSGNGGPATSAQINNPYGVAVDGSTLYIADTGNHAIRKVSKGVITTVAGTGTAGFSGDGGPATSAQLNYPYHVAIDRAGSLYIADTYNNRIREVTKGVITTIAGTGKAAFSGDGGPAAAAELNSPNGIALDATGNIYFADELNNRIRKIENTVAAPKPALTAAKLLVGKAVAGKSFTVSLTVKDKSTGRGVKGTVACTGKLAGKTLKASGRTSAASGKASCTWRLPTSARHKRFAGSIAVSYRGAKISRSFAKTVS